MPEGEGGDEPSALERLWSREIRHLHRQFSRLGGSSSALGQDGGQEEEGQAKEGAAAPAARGKAWFLGGGYPLACCSYPEGGVNPNSDIRPGSPQSPSQEWDHWTANGEWEPKMIVQSEKEDAVREGRQAEREAQGAEEVAEVDAETMAGDAEFVELWPGLGKLQPENLDFWELTRGRAPRRIPCVEHRSVTPRQLRTLLAFLKKRCNEHGVIRGWYDPRTGAMLHYKTFNFHHLLHWIVKPLTQKLQCSFAEAMCSDTTSSVRFSPSTPSSPGTTPSLKGGSSRVKWFVGHWWGESLLHFTQRIMRHAGQNEESYWLVPLCTNLYECSGLAVSDVHDKAGIVGLHNLTSLKVYLSGCTGLKAIEELEKGLPAFQSLTLLELNVAYCWELVDVEELGKGLSKLRFLRTLRMNFSDCSGLRSVASLGRGFVSLASLTTLDLNLSGCTGITTIDELGASLGRLEELTSLKLNFSDCTRLQAVGGLGRGFRALRRLTTLDLSFAGCTELTSVDELGRGLVMLEALTTLEVNFFGCSGLVSVDDLGRGLALMRSLAILKLELFGCSGLLKIDELQRGIAALRAHKELSRLEVNIAGCQALGSAPAGR